MRELNFDELSLVSGAADQSDTDEPTKQPTDAGVPKVVVSAPRPTVCEPGMYIQQIVYTSPGASITAGINTKASVGTSTAAEAGANVSGTFQGTATQVTCASPMVTCKLDDGNTITRPGGPDTCNVYKKANSSR